jgi:hypothetical protein
MSAAATLGNELTDSLVPAAGSLSDSTGNEPNRFSSLNAVCGRVPHLHSAALPGPARPRLLLARPFRGGRVLGVATRSTCVSAAPLKSHKRR